MDDSTPTIPQDESRPKDELAELKEQLAKCEMESKEHLAGWQRAKADFINYKKDEMRRLEEFARYGSEEMVRELITVLDNFDLAISTLEKHGEVEKGIYLIRSQLADFLKRKGVEKIELKIGDQFDPKVAEAVAETESDHPPGSVVEEIEPGYRMGEKLIRPARVRIARDKPQVTSDKENAT